MVAGLETQGTKAQARTPYPLIRPVSLGWTETHPDLHLHWLCHARDAVRSLGPEL